jgi:hypothetical protein
MSYQLFRASVWIILVVIGGVPITTVLVQETQNRFSEGMAAPLLCGGLLSLCCCLELVKVLRSTEKGDASSEPKSSAIFRALLILLLSGILIFSIEWFGFFLATILLLLLSMYLLGERRLSRYLVGAGVWAVIVYLLFGWILMIPLPQGSFFS